jgi:hypothetical protein
MLFSCKISNAILAYLEQEGEDIQNLLDSSHLPEDFLRDPSFWIKAHEMEDFLRTAVELTREGTLILQKAGHAGPVLRSWGVLDSVLRMMPKPSEIFNQPQRFLSYFISPEPPLENVINNEMGIELDLPVSSEMFPLVTSYLKYAFESLPVYIGQEMGICEWQNIHLKIRWNQSQASIFSEDPGRQISPDLLRSIVASLEKHQQELEAKNRELQEKNDQLLRSYEESLQRVNAQTSQSIQKPESDSAGDLLDGSVSHYDNIGGTSLDILQNNFAKMTDYMVRAQQLVTLLVGADRLKAPIKEAMRRTDWEIVKMNFPQIVNQSLEILRQSAKKNQEVHAVAFQQKSQKSEPSSQSSISLEN